MKYFILLCSLFIVSCSMQKSILSNYNEEGFNITSLKGSSIRLYVHPVIHTGLFARSFDNEYTSNGSFCSILSDKLKEKLSTFSKISIHTDLTMNKLFLNQSSPDSMKVKELFQKIDENYLLGIKQVIFTRNADPEPQTITTNTSANTRGSRQGGGAKPSGFKNANACVIKIVAEVWSVKEMKKVAEFTSIGQSQVILNAWGRALNEALDVSVSNFADYIED